MHTRTSSFRKPRKTQYFCTLVQIWHQNHCGAILSHEYTEHHLKTPLLDDPRWWIKSSLGSSRGTHSSTVSFQYLRTLSSTYQCRYPGQSSDPQPMIQCSCIYLQFLRSWGLSPAPFSVHSAVRSSGPLLLDFWMPYSGTRSSSLHRWALPLIYLFRT